MSRASVLLVVLVASLSAVLSAPAASVDPRLLVLHQIDVPPRYEFDKSNSVLIPESVAQSSDPQAKRLVTRYGLVTGYFARYLNTDPPRWRYVTSAAYVFRSSDGAKRYLASLRKSVSQAPQRGSLRLGDEAGVYSWKSLEKGTVVLWQHGRVVAFVGCSQMTRHRDLALAQARKQQRRIGAEIG